MKGGGTRRPKLIGIALASGFLAAGTALSAEILAYEPFEYERRQGHVSTEIPGEGIAGLDGGSGWAGPWTSLPDRLNAGIPAGAGDFAPNDDWGVVPGARSLPLAYTDLFGHSLKTSGNQLRTAFGNNSWDRRTLAEPIGEPGSVVWLSFLAQSHGISTASPRYAFVELASDGGNRAWFGKVAPIETGNWGLQLPDQPGGGVAGDAGPSYPMNAQTLFLVKLEFPEVATGETVISFWLNPPDLTNEGNLLSPLLVFTTAYTTYNQVGIAGRYSTDFDEIRIGTSFASVLPLRSPPVPRLTLEAAPTGGELRLSWPIRGATAMKLQSSTDLEAWSDVSFPWEAAEERHVVTVSPDGDRQFFRLQHSVSGRPDGRLATLENAGWQPQAVREGVVYYERHFQDLFGAPQLVHVLAVGLDHPEVRLELTATDVWGLSRVPIPELAEHAGAFAAINGGFAPARVYPEVGYGIMKFRGVVWPFVNDPSFNDSYEALGRNAVGIDAAGDWHFASRGAEGWEMGAQWPDDWPEVFDAMAGGSRLVRAGEVHPLVVPETTQGAYLEHEGLHRLTFNRHPRTAIGITPERVAVLVTVAGRFPDIAAGMTLRELAQLLLFMGCRDALELDGGGSSTMWIRDEPFGGVVNYPTDNGLFDHEGARSLRLAVLLMETE